MSSASNGSMGLLHDLPDGHPRLRYFVAMVREAKRLGIEIDLQTLQRGRSGSHLLDALDAGRASLVAINTCHLEAFSPFARAMNEPFALDDGALCSPVATVALLSGLAPSLAARRYRPLGLMRAAEQLYCTRRPVGSPADLTGLRIRVPGGAALSGTLARLGATPISAPLADVPRQLRSGELDGLSVSVCGWLTAIRDEAPHALLIPGMTLLTYAVLCRESWLGTMPVASADALLGCLHRNLTLAWSAMRADDAALMEGPLPAGLHLTVVAHADRGPWELAARERPGSNRSEDSRPRVTTEREP